MLNFISKQIFKIKGWKLNGKVPPHIKKAVLVAAPHTSNWDFVYAMAALYQIDIGSLHFLAKKDLFKFPLGVLLRAMGGIPVDRSKQTNMVDTIATMFDNSKELIMLIPPEGTRNYVKHWKTGFYYTALKANVPILLGYLDFGKKEAGIRGVFYPTGDIDKDMDQIKAFYKGITPKYPSQSSLAE